MKSVKRTLSLITILGFLAILFVLSASPDASVGPAEAEGNPTRALVVSVVRHRDVVKTMGTKVEDGGMCLPYGSLGPWGSVGPHLVITDHTGRVVGVMDVWQGRWETSTEGVKCVVRAEVLLAGAPFYTFTVADVYKRTVLRTVLADAGWSYEIEVDVP